MPKHFSQQQLFAKSEARHVGFVALISVLVVSALGVLFAAGLSSRSINESKITIAREVTSRARFLAEACAEDALRKIQQNTNYAGSETLVFGTDTCRTEAVVISGQNRTVRTRSTIAGFTQRIQISLLRSGGGNITILSWRNVPDFF